MKSEPILPPEVENGNTETEPDETTCCDLACQNCAAHDAEANAANMTSHQYAMKHKSAAGMKGHRSRMMLALQELRKNEAEKQLTK